MVIPLRMRKRHFARILFVLIAELFGKKETREFSKMRNSPTIVFFSYYIVNLILSWCKYSYLPLLELCFPSFQLERCVVIHHSGISPFCNYTVKGNCLLFKMKKRTQYLIFRHQLFYLSKYKYLISYYPRHLTFRYSTLKYLLSIPIK